MDDDLRRIRAVAEYQFGPGSGAALFPDDVRIVHSRNTGRIRHIHLGDALLASFRPNDGVFTLTIAAAERLLVQVPDLGYNRRPRGRPGGLNENRQQRAQICQIEKTRYGSLLSSVVPGNERTVQFLKDELYRQKAQVFHYKMMDIHAGGHGSSQKN